MTWINIYKKKCHYFPTKSEDVLLPSLSGRSRIRSRLEEEDFDQVPQLATSLLIELKRLGLGMAWIVGPKLHGFFNIFHVLWWEIFWS